MMQVHPIQVLLATYNGEKFLSSQIDSLLTQTYPNISILARDDGSRDNTPAVLQDYAQRFPDMFRVLPTNRPTGSPQLNFLRLMEASTSEFVMFADQDDVWDEDKIAATMSEMQRLISIHGNEKPLLVFSDLVVVDEELSTMHESFWREKCLQPGVIWHLPSLLRQNVVTGNTMLINRSLLEIALKMAPETVMHDWWIAIVANTFGYGSYLKRTTTRYRQHEANVLGAGKEVTTKHTLLPPFSDRAGWAREWARVYTHATAFLRTYDSSLPANKRKVFEDAVRCTESRSGLERVFRMLRHRFFRYGARANLAMLLHLWRPGFAQEAAEISKMQAAAARQVKGA